MSLVVVGTLLLTSCLFYVAYRAITTEKLSELEQSFQPSMPVTQQSSNHAPVIQNVPMEKNPFKSDVYPATVLLPIDWGNPYWAEDPNPNLYGEIYAQYTALHWDYLPAGHTLPKAIRIKIPSIQVDALVEELELVDLETARAYETPNKIVGHIPETANPGGIGNGWYFGHLESALNREGAIFKDLPLIPEKIRRAEPVFIIVDTKTTSYLYQVTATSVERKEDLRVTESSSPVITLVTCVPRLVYDHRLIVSAKLVGSTNRNS